MKKRCWEPATLARWFRAIRAHSARFLPLPALLVAGCAFGQGLEPLGRVYWEKKTAAARAQLAAYAAAHPRDQNGALAHLALGWTDLERGRPSAALPHLEAAKRRLPALADYTSFALGRALLASGRAVEARTEFRAVLSHQPLSLHFESAAVILARSLLEDGDAAGAAGVLGNGDGKWKLPQAYLLLGSAYEALQDGVRASIAYQQVFYGQPLSAEAQRAGVALAALKTSLGRNYPPPMPQAILDRAEKLAAAAGAGRARALRELQEAIPQLAGDARDLAKVRIGVVRYQGQENAAALKYLDALQLAAGEADAERMYYALAAARRLGNSTRMDEILSRMPRLYRTSKWRMEALIARGNQHLLVNDADAYLPVFAACAADFSTDPRAAYCHWKVAWAAYLRREPRAAVLLREHIEKYPASEKYWAAHYFLGRVEEGRSNPGMAKGYYEAIARRQPNVYYALAARRRIETPALRKVLASAPDLVDGVDPARKPPDFQVDAATRRRVERARLLISAGLRRPGESELFHGARTEAKPLPSALELARMASARGDQAQGIRYVKALVPGYLGWSFEDAPDAFWRLIFPLPYRAQLDKHARARGLDPFLVAGLIRQESEFDPRAVSRARAMGLMQILPSTGKALSRQVGVRRFGTSLLFQPDLNLRMGTLYFSRLLKDLNGKVEAALAAYNAGKSRADAWLQWGDFREQAEFIETIPFTETREYVQVVLRNADIYRRLHARAQPGKAVAAAQVRK